MDKIVTETLRKKFHFLGKSVLLNEFATYRLDEPIELNRRRIQIGDTYLKKKK